MKKIFLELKNKNLLGYILAFSGMVFFIVLFLWGYLYQFYYRTIYHDFENSNREYLTAISSRHENDLQITSDIMTQLNLAGAQTEFLLEEKPMNNFKLRNMLYQYSSVSHFFDRIFFFYHKDDYLYNPASSIEVGKFVTQGLRMEESGSEALQEILYREDSGIHILPEQPVSGRMVERYGEVVDRAVSYAIPMEPRRNSTALFVVGSGYYDKLTNAHEGEQRTVFIYQDDLMVVNRGEAAGLEEALPRLWQQTDEGQKEVKADNGTVYLATWLQGDSGLTYCTLQSKQVFSGKIFSGQWGILLILALCSIPTSIALVALSRSLFRKVKNINILLGEEEAYNLENIENGIRILVESRKEINQENLLLKRTRFISNFVRGQYASREEVLAASRKTIIDADKGYYAVALMGDHGNSNENEAHEMMLRAIVDNRGVDGYGIHLINNNQGLFVAFADRVEEIRQLWEELFIIGKNCCEEFIMSVSGFHEDVLEVTKAYLEADSAYATRLLVDNSRIIYFGDVALEEPEAAISDTYLQRLKNAIRGREEAEAGKVIREICDRLRSSRQSLLTFRILCNDIIHIMLTEWNTTNADFENIYNVFALSQCLTVNDFHDILLEVSQKLMENYREPGGAEPDFIAAAVECMKTNYSEPDFNMSALAEALSCSGVTLAVKFKSVMEISPSEYLAILRMEKAKELLRETSLPIKEVCIQVGYEDPRVFLRRFKKYTGRTPGQYREEKS